MKTIDVFVYGTLKPGGQYHQAYCAPYLKQAQPAQVQGRLYDLPHLGYPVITLGTDWVKGYLFTLDAIALSGLDYLEGYAPPEQPVPQAQDDFVEEYRRQQIAVFDLAGQVLGDAWIYVMDSPPAGAIWLAEGEWLSAARGEM